MTLLQIMNENDATDVKLRTTDGQAVQKALAGIGVEFDRWNTDADFDAWNCDTSDVLAEYAEQIDALRRRDGYRLVDIARIQPDATDPEWLATASAARAKFLAEHRHSENEVRFFAAGRACFYLRAEGCIHAVVGGEGDLLSVPAGTRHWFDMGPEPRFVAVRFFEEEDGWVGDFTGDGIASRFPSLDDLLVGS